MSNIIEAKEASAFVKSGKDIRLIDCRFSLTDPNWGKVQYKTEHIAGSVFFDLDKDLSGPAKKHGGRHPLPDLEQFQAKLEQYGISNDTIIIAYDQGGAPFAARFWWMMKYIGHKEVYVVNGGYDKMSEAGFQADNRLPEFEYSEYKINLQPNLIADMIEVRQAANGEKEAIIIDSREPARFRGEVEPLDKIAGHIPGAINKFWQEGVQGMAFKENADQKQRFSDIPENKEIIVYCGSGVTAAPNMLLLKNIGYPNVKLYIGSYSDWVSYEENKIETADSESK